MTDIRDQDSEYMLAFSDDASSPSPETVNEHNRTTKPGNQNTISEQDGQDENQTHRARTDLDERSVYLGNLHYAVLPIELEKFCSPMGKVDKVTIIVDRYSSLPTGIAFVAFKEKKSAEKAVEELDGKILHGRQTKVRAKVAKSSRDDTSSVRGRGAFRGRGRGSSRGRGRGRGKGRGRGGKGRGSGGTGGDHAA
ncbi:hypothetical protein CJI97_001937 [Candidozyma auris]|nr:hypothetical protein CJI97_001937 [[Candida] auris]